MYSTSLRHIHFSSRNLYLTRKKDRHADRRYALESVAMLDAEGVRAQRPPEVAPEPRQEGRSAAPLGGRVSLVFLSADSLARTTGRPRRGSPLRWITFLVSHPTSSCASKCPSRCSVRPRPSWSTDGNFLSSRLTRSSQSTCLGVQRDNTNCIG